MAVPTSDSITLSLETVRKLAVVKQGLHRRPSATGKETILEGIHQIGLLQLDSVNVVARSHYLVMLSRVGFYDPDDLDALLHPERALFEQWAHAACLIPVEDYAYFAPIILGRRGHPLSPWRLEALGDDPQGTLDAVLAQVQERGPTSSSDFDDPRPTKGTWWNRKPARNALDVLYQQGYLMVDRRVNFQCYFDLAERVLPATSDESMKTVDDWHRWAALRSVSYLGVATAKQVSDYYRLNIPITRAMIDTLAAERAIVTVEVEGWKEIAYMDNADLPLVREIAGGMHQPEVTTFLSPFDNLIWNRDRVRDLFGFDYRIEMYTPAAERKYGYYVLPILHRGRLVGRLDPKADRKTGTLVVRAIYLEPSESLTDDLLSGIDGALREFMAFHNCHSLIIERSDPESLRVALQ